MGFIRARSKRLLDILVVIWMFSGGLVMIEPSPYEIMLFAVLPVAIVAGMGLHRRTFNLLALLIAFMPFALIAGFQVRHNEPTKGIMFVGITMFLWLTGFVAANYVADAPRRHLRLMIRAYTAVALLVAVIATLAYLKVLPGHDLFLRYGRAKATFKDPNVFGPFLMLPAMFALQRVFLGTQRRAILGGAVFMVLFVGVFVSFSRGAWGHLFASALLLFVLIFVLEARAIEKPRMIGIALAGMAVVIVALAGLLSIPSVSKLFEIRASVTQSYDTGTTGRFGRQGYAFALALEHPWGLGPLEFAHGKIDEEPHDTYATVMLSYGWGGGFAYWVLIGMTLWRGTIYLFRASPNRLLLIPLMATYIPLILESAIIDTDHWRHFFLIVGLIWGITAAYGHSEETVKSRQAALV